MQKIDAMELRNYVTRLIAEQQSFNVVNVSSESYSELMRVVVSTIKRQGLKVTTIAQKNTAVAAGTILTGGLLGGITGKAIHKLATTHYDYEIEKSLLGHDFTVRYKHGKE